LIEIYRGVKPTNRRNIRLLGRDDVRKPGLRDRGVIRRKPVGSQTSFFFVRRGEIAQSGGM